MVHTEDVVIEITDLVGWVTINRPGRMNALAKSTFSRLVEASLELDARDDVRVVVYSGEGSRAFSAGVDLKELDAAGSMLHPMGGPSRNLNEVVLEMSKPTIAAINGVAAGAAANLPWPATFASALEVRELAFRRPRSEWAQTLAAWSCRS